MSELRIARRYAKALLGAAVESEVLEGVESDMRALYDLVRSSEDLRSFLGDPTIWPKSKAQFIDKLLKDRVDSVTLDFLLMTVSRGRAGVLEDILRYFAEILDEHRGVIATQVRSAFELAPEQKEDLQRRLSAYSGKKIRLEESVDPTLRGGVIIRLGDLVFDGSLEAQLKSLHRILVGG